MNLLNGSLSRSNYAIVVFGTIAASIFFVILVATINEDLGAGANILAMLILIPVILIQGIRRLHDIGKSGWWILCSFFPILNLALLIALLIRAGTAGVNDFGPPVA